MIPQPSSPSYTTHPFRLSYPFRPFSTLLFEDAFAIPASTPSPSSPLRSYTVKVNYTLSQWIRTPETLQHYFPKLCNVVSCFLRFTSLFILSPFPLFLHFRRTLGRALHSLSPPPQSTHPLPSFTHTNSRIDPRPKLVFSLLVSVFPSATTYDTQFYKLILVETSSLISRGY